MTQPEQSDSPIRRRTEGERTAYLQGMRAGIEAVARQFANQPGIDTGHYAVSGPLDRARHEVEIAESFGSTRS